jgi:TadE-like protein
LTFWHHRGHRICGVARFAWHDDKAAQLAEFAIALPLLVVFVVGIFDFSNAFTFKQKLTNIARDAARVAAADPANDLASQATPTSVVDAFQIIDNYLIANNISDCGITLSGSPTGLIWTSTSPVGGGCPPPGLTIIINRGYYFPATLATQPANVNCQSQALGSGTQTAVVATCVSIEYAYAWRFGNVASLLGASTLLPNTITATSVAMNEN